MRRRYKPYTSLLLLLLTIAGGAVAGEEIRVGGGGAAFVTIFQPIKPHFEKATGITLFNLQSSPKSGLINLIEGRVDVTAAAHTLDSMIELLSQDGIKVNRSALVVNEIGINRIVVIVNPSNRVDRLSKTQLKQIFTGQIDNWREVGGDDKDILVVWGRGTPGQNTDFTKRVLDGENVSKDALESTTYEEIRDTVASTPEAIGINPKSIANATIKIVDNDASLSNPIIAVTVGQPLPKVRRLIDYVRGEGKSHTRQ